MNSHNRIRDLETLDRINHTQIEHLERSIRLLEFHEASLLRTMISGGELTILGEPVRVHITWTEGRPHGLADEQILEFFPLPSLES